MRTPDPDEVHLWCFGLDSSDADRWAVLSEDERARANRYHFERDRLRFIAARATLRRVLASYDGQDPAMLRFATGGSGKPFIAGPGALRFNLSHSGDLAAIVVAAFEIGVDIEQIRSIDDGIAERYFAEGERAALRDLRHDAWQRAFFRCWTRKEAVVKALGDGLSVPLDSFEVSVACAAPAALLHVRGDRDEASLWQLHHFDPAPGCVGAIAARRRGWRVMVLAAG